MPITRDVIPVVVEALGTEVYVPRYNAFRHNAIMKRADELYPLPDPTPFQMPVPDALIDGDMTPASQNPEYQLAIARVMLKRNAYWQDAVLSFLEVEGATREEVITAFAVIIQPMRQRTELPEDDFVATMRFGVLKPSEYAEIMDIAKREQALSQEEIRNGLRIFRRDVQRNSANGHHPEQSTPDIQQNGQVQTQQPTG